MKRVIVLFTISLIALTIGFTASAITNIVSLPHKAHYNLMSADAKRQVECLAQNIYYEAGYEPEVGQVAVAFVTMNRVKSGLFESDICGVVKQKSNNVCQFTWYCENTTRSLTGRAEVVYNGVRNLAIYVYANYDKLEDPSKGALFYHADYVSPQWKNMEYLTKIGRHLFYNRKDLKWIS